jgi:hypothetical protein
MSKKWTKVWAMLALLGIIIWVLWTWALVLFSSGSTEQQISPEDYAKLQELIKEQENQIEENITSTWEVTQEVLSGTTLSWVTLSWTTLTWALDINEESIETSTWETK